MSGGLSAQAAAAAQVIRRARAVVRAAGLARPPFPPERYAARCGVRGIRRSALPGGAASVVEGGDSTQTFAIVLDSRLIPHTPQWNGALALALARTFLPPGAAGPAAARLAELGAAELLLPMRIFRPIAARTDLTMDGLRDLAMRFAAPARLTVRQWLRAGTWHGLALWWREEGGALRLGWRAASPRVRFPRTAVIGAPAEAVWSDPSRLYATLRTGRPHHGVEEIRTGDGAAWWFTRFGIVGDRHPAVRDAGAGGAGAGGRGVLALVALPRGR